MSEFKDKLRNSVAISNISDEIEKDRDCIVSLLNVVENEFKGWQPPKQLVEVPQFVSDWFEKNDYNIDGNIKALARTLKDKPQINWTSIDKWFMKSSNKPVETLIRMKLEGYTIKKEQLYVIEYPMSALPYVANMEKNQENEIVIIGYTSIKECAKRFTEQEVKDIDKRYWAFAVKVDEVDE